MPNKELAFRIHKDTWKLVSQISGMHSKQYIQNILAYNHGEGMGAPCFCTAPRIVLSGNFSGYDYVAQAFMLLHELVHVENHHHRMAMTMMKDLLLRHVAPELRIMFINYALDCWTNQIVCRMFPDAERKVIEANVEFAPWKWHQDRIDKIEPYNWIAAVATQLERTKTHRKNVLKKFDLAFPKDMKFSILETNKKQKKQ